MIGKMLDVPSNDRDEGTIDTTVLGIVHGMDIVRVHNVLVTYVRQRLQIRLSGEKKNG